MIGFNQLYLSLAWRNIWRNKRRTIITMASIVFAVVLAVGLNSLKEGILFKMQENMVSYYTGSLQIHEQGYWDEKTLENSFIMNDPIQKAIEEIKDIRGYTARLESFALSASDEMTKGAMIVGIDPDNESRITNLTDKIVEGEYLKGQDQSVLLATGLADYLKLGVGDTIVIIGQGYHGATAAGKYAIKGIVKLGSPELNKRMVYMPLQLAQYLFSAEDRLTAVVLDVDNINEVSDITAKLSASIPTYEVMDWKTLVPELNNFIEAERAENKIFLFVLYLLISFGIFGTILMMLRERQFEFGVLVAIGMQNIKLSGVVVLENIFISITGAIIGGLLSIPVVFYFHKYPIHVGESLGEFYEDFGFEPIFYFSIEPWIFYSQAIVVLFIALGLSLYPLFQLSRLRPLVAMRK